MAKRSIEESTLIAIADAIREKGGTTAGLDPEGEMPQAILDIKGAEITELDNEAGGKTVYINSEAPEEAVLPEGFTRLKWIQSSGTQYIKTGYTSPSTNLRIVLKFRYTASHSTTTLFGSEGTTSSGKYSICPYGDTPQFYVGNTTSITAGSAPPDADCTLDVTAHNGTLTAIWNGTTYTASYSGTLNTSQAIALFGNNASGTVAEICSYRMYSCEIYGGGTLARNYIPCLNASGEAGLWDTVTQAFFGDAAGVGFIAGPVVLDYTLPEGFEELAWIESDGRQYVDTLFKPNQDTRVVMDAQFLSENTEAASALFGARTSTSSKAYSIHYNTENDGLYHFYGDGYTSGLTVNDRTSRLVYDMNKNVLTAGNVRNTRTYSAFQCDYSLYLMALNNAGAVAFRILAQVYSCQIYDNGIIVRYYVPCRTNTGEVGLWDVVHEVFYGDAAGVGFIAGPKVSVSKVVLEDEVLIDLTGDTISPETVLAGFIGHDKTGAQFVGELVQKAGGRPVATGEIISSSTTHSVTGLAFAPKIVFVIKTNSTPPTDRTSSYFALYYNAETGDRFYYSCTVEWTGYGTTLGSISGNVITLSGNGFSISSSSSVKFYDLYRWVAIGAEE